MAAHFNNLRTNVYSQNIDRIEDTSYTDNRSGRRDFSHNIDRPIYLDVDPDPVQDFRPHVHVSGPKMFLKIDLDYPIYDIGFGEYDNFDVIYGEPYSNTVVWVRDDGWVKLNSLGIDQINRVVGGSQNVPPTPPWFDPSWSELSDLLRLNQNTKHDENNDTIDIDRAWIYGVNFFPEAFGYTIDMVIRIAQFYKQSKYIKRFKYQNENTGNHWVNYFLQHKLNTEIYVITKHNPNKRMYRNILADEITPYHRTWEVTEIWAVNTAFNEITTEIVARPVIYDVYDNPEIKHLKAIYNEEDDYIGNWKDTFGRINSSLSTVSFSLTTNNDYLFNKDFEPTNCTFLSVELPSAVDMTKNNFIYDLHDVNARENLWFLTAYTTSIAHMGKVIKFPWNPIENPMPIGRNYNSPYYQPKNYNEHIFGYPKYPNVSSAKLDGYPGFYIERNKDSTGYVEKSDNELYGTFVNHFRETVNEELYIEYFPRGTDRTISGRDKWDWGVAGTYGATIPGAGVGNRPLGGKESREPFILCRRIHFNNAVRVEKKRKALICFLYQKRDSIEQESIDNNNWDNIGKNGNLANNKIFNFDWFNIKPRDQWIEYPPSYHDISPNTDNGLTIRSGESMIERDIRDVDSWDASLGTVPIEVLQISIVVQYDLPSIDKYASFLLTENTSLSGDNHELYSWNTTTSEPYNADNWTDFGMNTNYTEWTLNKLYSIHVGTHNGQFKYNNVNIIYCYKDDNDDLRTIVHKIVSESYRLGGLQLSPASPVQASRVYWHKLAPLRVAGLFPGRLDTLIQNNYGMMEGLNSFHISILNDAQWDYITAVAESSNYIIDYIVEDRRPYVMRYSFHIKTDEFDLEDFTDEYYRADELLELVVRNGYVYTYENPKPIGHVNEINFWTTHNIDDVTIYKRQESSWHSDHVYTVKLEGVEGDTNTSSKRILGIKIQSRIFDKSDDFSESHPQYSGGFYINMDNDLVESVFALSKFIKYDYSLPWPKSLAEDYRNNFPESEHILKTINMSEVQFRSLLSYTTLGSPSPNYGAAEYLETLMIEGEYAYAVVQYSNQNKKIHFIAEKNCDIVSSTNGINNYPFTTYVKPSIFQPTLPSSPTGFSFTGRSFEWGDLHGGIRRILRYDLYHTTDEISNFVEGISYTKYAFTVEQIQSSKSSQTEPKRTFDKTKFTLNEPYILEYADSEIPPRINNPLFGTWFIKAVNNTGSSIPSGPVHIPNIPHTFKIDFEGWISSSSRDATTINWGITPGYIIGSASYLIVFKPSSGGTQNMGIQSNNSHTVYEEGTLSVTLVAYGFITTHESSIYTPVLNLEYFKTTSLNFGYDYELTQYYFEFFPGNDIVLQYATFELQLYSVIPNINDNGVWYSPGVNELNSTKIYIPYNSYNSKKFENGTWRVLAKQYGEVKAISPEYKNGFTNLINSIEDISLLQSAKPTISYLLTETHLTFTFHIPNIPGTEQMIPGPVEFIVYKEIEKEVGAGNELEIYFKHTTNTTSDNINREISVSQEISMSSVFATYYIVTFWCLNSYDTNVYVNPFRLNQDFYNTILNNIKQIFAIQNISRPGPPSNFEIIYPSNDPYDLQLKWSADSASIYKIYITYENRFEKMYETTNNQIDINPVNNKFKTFIGNSRIGYNIVISGVHLGVETEKSQTAIPIVPMSITQQSQSIVAQIPGENTYVFFINIPNFNGSFLYFDYINVKIPLQEPGIKLLDTNEYYTRIQYAIVSKEEINDDEFKPFGDDENYHYQFIYIDDIEKNNLLDETRVFCMKINFDDILNFETSVIVEMKVIDPFTTPYALVYNFNANPQLIPKDYEQIVIDPIVNEKQLLRNADFDVTDAGSFHTKRINTKNVMSANSFVLNPSTNEYVEPILNISSKSAINLEIKNFPDIKEIGNNIKFTNGKGQETSLNTIIFNEYFKINFRVPVLLINLFYGSTISFKITDIQIPALPDGFLLTKLRLTFNLYLHGSDRYDMLNGEILVVNVINLTIGQIRSKQYSMLEFNPPSIDPPPTDQPRYTISTDIRVFQSDIQYVDVLNVRILMLENIPILDNIIITDAYVINTAFKQSIYVKFEFHKTIVNDLTTTFFIGFSDLSHTIFDTNTGISQNLSTPSLDTYCEYVYDIFNHEPFTSYLESEYYQNFNSTIDGYETNAMLYQHQHIYITTDQLPILVKNTLNMNSEFNIKDDLEERIRIGNPPNPHDFEIYMKGEEYYIKCKLEYTESTDREHAITITTYMEFILYMDEVEQFTIYKINNEYPIPIHRDGTLEYYDLQIPNTYLNDGIIGVGIWCLIVKNMYQKHSGQSNAMDINNPQLNYTTIEHKSLSTYIINLSDPLPTNIEIISEHYNYLSPNRTQIYIDRYTIEDEIPSISMGYEFYIINDLQIRNSFIFNVENVPINGFPNVHNIRKNTDNTQNNFLFQCTVSSTSVIDDDYIDNVVINNDQNLIEESQIEELQTYFKKPVTETNFYNEQIILFYHISKKVILDEDFILEIFINDNDNSIEHSLNPCELLSLLSPKPLDIRFTGLNRSRNEEDNSYKDRTFTLNYIITTPGFTAPELNSMKCKHWIHTVVKEGTNDVNDDILTHHFLKASDVTLIDIETRTIEYEVINDIIVLEKFARAHRTCLDFKLEWIKDGFRYIYRTYVTHLSANQYWDINLDGLTATYFRSSNYKNFKSINDFHLVRDMARHGLYQYIKGFDKDTRPKLHISRKNLKKNYGERGYRWQRKDGPTDKQNEIYTDYEEVTEQIDCITPYNIEWPPTYDDIVDQGSSYFTYRFGIENGDYDSTWLISDSFFPCYYEILDTVGTENYDLWVPIVAKGSESLIYGYDINGYDTNKENDSSLLGGYQQPGYNQFPVDYYTNYKSTYVDFMDAYIISGIYENNPCIIGNTTNLDYTNSDANIWEIPNNVTYMKFKTDYALEPTASYIVTNTAYGLHTFYSKSYIHDATDTLRYDHNGLYGYRSGFQYSTIDNRPLSSFNYRYNRSVYIIKKITTQLPKWNRNTKEVDTPFNPFFLWSEPNEDNIGLNINGIYTKRFFYNGDEDRSFFIDKSNTDLNKIKLHIKRKVFNGFHIDLYFDHEIWNSDRSTPAVWSELISFYPPYDPQDTTNAYTFPFTNDNQWQYPKWNENEFHYSNKDIHLYLGMYPGNPRVDALYDEVVPFKNYFTNADDIDATIPKPSIDIDTVFKNPWVRHEFLLQMKTRFGAEAIQYTQQSVQGIHDVEIDQTVVDWRLLNTNGEGLDVGRWDSLLRSEGNEVDSRKEGVNTFSLEDFSLDYVKGIANQYDEAVYIVQNERSVHRNYYILTGKRNITAYKNLDGKIFVYTNRKTVLLPGYAIEPFPVTYEEEPPIGDWRLLNEDGRGLDVGRWDSLVRGGYVPGHSRKPGINYFHWASYSLDEVKEVANRYSSAFYIVKEMRADNDYQNDYRGYYIYNGKRNIIPYDNMTTIDEVDGRVIYGLDVAVYSENASLLLVYTNRVKGSISVPNEPVWRLLNQDGLGIKYIGSKMDSITTSEAESAIEESEFSHLKTPFDYVQYIADTRETAVYIVVRVGDLDEDHYIYDIYEGSGTIVGNDNSTGREFIWTNLSDSTNVTKQMPYHIY